MEDELSSISLLWAEAKASERSRHLNGTSAEQDPEASQENEETDFQDEDVQALLDELEQLHSFADGVEDRMDMLLAKLDDMLGVLDPGETKERAGEEVGLSAESVDERGTKAETAKIERPQPERKGA